jgi:hypothetical protein
MIMGPALHSVSVDLLCHDFLVYKLAELCVSIDRGAVRVTGPACASWIISYVCKPSGHYMNGFTAIRRRGFQQTVSTLKGSRKWI